MKFRTISTFAVGISAWLIGFMVATPIVASAAPAAVNVPCTSQAALVTAIDAATAGGGTIKLASGCHYLLKAADNGENGLPVIATRIRVNGNGATIDVTNKVRAFEGAGPVAN